MYVYVSVFVFLCVGEYGQIKEQGCRYHMRRGHCANHENHKLLPLEKCPLYGVCDVAQVTDTSTLLNLRRKIL